MKTSELIAQAIWDGQDGDLTEWEHLFQAEAQPFRAMAIHVIDRLREAGVTLPEDVTAPE